MEQPNSKQLESYKKETQVYWDLCNTIQDLWKKHGLDSIGSLLVKESKCRESFIFARDALARSGHIQAADYQKQVVVHQKWWNWFDESARELYNSSSSRMRKPTGTNEPERVPVKSALARLGPYEKTELCEDYKQGRPCRNKTCLYAHSAQELRPKKYRSKYKVFQVVSNCFLMCCLFVENSNLKRWQIVEMATTVTTRPSVPTDMENCRVVTLLRITTPL